ncbi:MAG: ATP-grasp domain-containing protein [Candidatus Thorarchaeota archaeon]
MKSVLIVGFNTRPLAYSLKNGGYEVYAVDFFGDLDLYPNIKDCIIVTKKLQINYPLIIDRYSKFLAEFTIDLMQMYPKINYLLIGSGLDDSYKERETILNEIKKSKYEILSVNNKIDVIKKARNIENIYNFLKSKEYNVPLTYSFDEFKSKINNFEFPFILKKKTGSGGINVNKIENENQLSFFIKKQKTKRFNPSDWLIQEYINGLPISCTVISNGSECEVISINRQIIGLKFLNPPKKFMYCGNIVPAYIFKEDEKLISEISVFLTKMLGLRGINGFDFVLKDHYPYLMEINPRIPGSINVSETVLNLNLLDLHIKSFVNSNWEFIKNTIKCTKPKGFATKLIMYAPKDIDKEVIPKINQLENLHDKTEPKTVLKDEPLCTILYKDKNLSESYFGALKIAIEIKKIIGD